MSLQDVPLGRFCSTGSEKEGALAQWGSLPLKAVNLLCFVPARSARSSLPMCSNAHPHAQELRLEFV